ncbi:hypothetical protein GQ457_16G016070 [Hibiscus cannabinus]
MKTDRSEWKMLTQIIRSSQSPKCWTVFERHGIVVDVFIPQKTMRDGARFGFVRMQSKADTDRVIERFDGFWLYGSKVRVRMEQHDARESFWHRKRQLENGKQGFPGRRIVGLMPIRKEGKTPENFTAAPRSDEGVVKDVTTKVDGIADRLKRVVVVAD